MYFFHKKNNSANLNLILASMHVAILWQSALLLEAFNKDRASLPQPMLTPPPPPPPMPLPTPDPRTQEMINEKLKKAEDLGKRL